MKTRIIKTYYDNGALSQKLSYLNGVKHGLQKWHYKNGQLDREFYIQNGTYHGTCQTWLNDGRRYSIYKWNNNRLNGIAITFKYK